MSFFAELRRRNVFKVGVAYVVAAWLLLQMTEVLTELLDLPDVAGRFVVLILIIGFVPALIFAWAFELTPEGIKRDHEVDHEQSIAPHTGRKLDFAIIGMLVIVAGYFMWESRFKAPDAASDPIQTSEQTTAPATDRDTIAVLPFANRSNQDDDLFFTDGIHDDLLTQLAKIGNLKVISRTSVMEYRDTTKKIPEIAAELGAGKILEGGVQRAGQRIRINAQLIDVATDEHLWAETFDREMTVENIFDIQSEITRHIVQAVRGELSASEQQVLADAPTGNLAAYEAFLKARAATNLADYGRDKYIEAEPLAELAVESDPGFAQAWALLAEIHAQAIWIGYDRSPERHRQARDALAQALALAPQDPTVLAAQADQHYRLDNDYPAALALYKQAAARAPGDARIALFTAITERRLGLWEESIRTFEKARAMDPANEFIATQLVDTLGRMNAWERLEPLLNELLPRYPDSRDLAGARVEQLMKQHGDLKTARQLFNRIPPTDSGVYFLRANELPAWERDYDAWLAAWSLPEIHSASVSFGFVNEAWIGQIHHFAGREEEARLDFQRAVKRLAEETPSTRIATTTNYSNAALAHALLGNFAQARSLSEQAVQTMPLELDHLFGASTHNVQTRVLGLIGERDLAVERLAATLNQPMGFATWELRLSPNWDFLRDHPGFQELTK